MTEDDDWFERALADEEDAARSDEADDDAAADPFANAGQFSAADGDDDAGTDDDTDDETSPFADADSFAEAASDADSPAGDAEPASPFGEGDDSPFGGGGDADADSPFAGGDDSPFDGGDGGDEGGLFDDDFASAFGAASGPDGGGGGGGGEFDDADFESDIPRIKLGIQGLDDMIQGGVPERHLIVTIGSAGTGKTTFGLQFLHHGLQLDDPEKAVFITLEQSREAIVATAAERGWEFERLEDENLLSIVDLDPVEMANSLQNIRAELPELIRDFGADRLVLDSVSLLEMMYDNQAKRRTEVFDFTRSLKRAGVTTMLTSEASGDNPYASRHGIIEYLTDAVIFLQYVRQETRETRLAVEIQKIRNANHFRETKPYEITDEGISVYQQANIF
ncbi:MAG: KaiC domain-containing protein [Haloarculaceae archaeon]